MGARPIVVGLWGNRRNRNGLSALFHVEQSMNITEAQMARSAREDNPKLDPDPATNMVKDPEEWVSGDDPMTGAQASYLKTLSEEAKEPEAFAEGLSKAEASERID